jgi:hypothetical protein
MTINTSLAVSIAAALFALLSWIETRRMGNLTEIALMRQSYEKVERLPSVEALSVIEVGGKHRAKLIVFNQLETPFRVNCVKCFRYDPKRRNLINWVRSKLGSFDWDYTYEKAYWNPKGTLDDDEHYAEVALPFTFVKETEVLLVTLSDYDKTPYQQYKFEVITTQGTTSWEGVLPNGMTSLPFEHRRHIA